MSNEPENVVDVRTLVPAQRHAKIFQLVDELAAGAAFTLVNDTTPSPSTTSSRRSTRSSFPGRIWNAAPTCGG